MNRIYDDIIKAINHLPKSHKEDQTLDYNILGKNLSLLEASLLNLNQEFSENGFFNEKMITNIILNLYKLHVSFKGLDLSKSFLIIKNMIQKFENHSNTEIRKLYPQFFLLIVDKSPKHIFTIHEMYDYIEAVYLSTNYRLKDIETSIFEYYVNTTEKKSSLSSITSYARLMQMFLSKHYRSIIDSFHLKNDISSVTIKITEYFHKHHPFLNKKDTTLRSMLNLYSSLMQFNKIIKIFKRAGIPVTPILKEIKE
jgi:hypothetical protein